MTPSPTYTFRKVRPSDFPLLRRWRAAPHVRAWWDALPPDAPPAPDDSRVERWIVGVGGLPIAFLQDYAVHGWDDHHFAHLPPGTRGIDQYIGRADMLGRGHGPAFIAQRVRHLLASGAPLVATDPHPDNARAIAACRRVGFAVSGPPQQTAWGLVLPMHISQLA